MNWETIDNNSKRAKVFGGWLVLVYEPATTYDGTEVVFGHEWRVAMAFVPDKMHQWKL